MGWAAMLALMAAQMGGSALLDYFKPFSGSEKELLELQMKGAKDKDARELAALQGLQTEKSTADWQKILLQLGMGQVSDKRQTMDAAAGLKADAGMMRGQADALTASDPGQARLSSMMTQPANYKTILGLE